MIEATAGVLLAAIVLLLTAPLVSGNFPSKNCMGYKSYAPVLYPTGHIHNRPGSTGASAAIRFTFECAHLGEPLDTPIVQLKNCSAISSPS